MINEVQQKYYESQRTHSGNKAHKHGSGNRNDPFAANERISFSDYQEMLQQVNFELAWQEFDEINQGNDVEVLIDLACLQVVDAEAILKQKLYDLGRKEQINL